MQSPEPSAQVSGIPIDLSDAASIVGLLTLENAVLKRQHANDQMLIQQLMATGQSENGQSYGAAVDIREPGVVEPEN